MVTIYPLIDISDHDNVSDGTSDDGLQRITEVWSELSDITLRLDTGRIDYRTSQ